MKTYTMRGSNRWFGILLPNLFLLGMCLYGIDRILTNGYSRFYLFMVVTSLAFLIFAVRGLHQPSSIAIDNDQIMFSAFGRTQTFQISTLTFLHVRRFAYVKQALIRIGPQKIIGGRYWVDSRFPQYDELIERMEELEKVIRARSERLTKKVKGEV
jgi:hypothetical protein